MQKLVTQQYPSQSQRTKITIILMWDKSNVFLEKKYIKFIFLAILIHKIYEKLHSCFGSLYTQRDGSKTTNNKIFPHSQFTHNPMVSALFPSVFYFFCFSSASFLSLPSPSSRPSSPFPFSPLNERKI